VSSGDTGDWIGMPFGVVSGVELCMGVLDFGGDRQRERCSLGVNLRRPIITNGDFVASLCGSAYSNRAVVWCGEWSGPGIHVLDGSPRASRGRVCFWHGLWHFSASGHALVSIGVMTLRNAFDSCVKS